MGNFTISKKCNFFPFKMLRERFRKVLLDIMEKDIGKDKFRKVVELTVEMDKKVLQLGVKPDNAKKVLNVLYNEPRTTRNKLVEQTGLPYSTIKGAINAMLKEGVIVETTGYNRNQIFSFDKYINLFLK